MRNCIYTNSHKYKHATQTNHNVHAHALLRTHIQTLNPRHTIAHTGTQVHTHTYTDAVSHICAHVHTYADIHAHVHTIIYTLNKDFDVAVDKLQTEGSKKLVDYCD